MSAVRSTFQLIIILSLAIVPTTIQPTFAGNQIHPVTSSQVPPTQTASIYDSLIEPTNWGELIVRIADAELGRRIHEVGQERGQYPFDLARYLRRGEPWCSEFVSWVYKLAGCPLTEGLEGGWMYKGSRGLRHWFRQHTRFIKRDDPYWEHATPRPGDYIRYHTNFGGHSGIVAAAHGTTLYTIEGNVTDRVVRRVISAWRDRRDIDGIGVITGPGVLISQQ